MLPSRRLLATAFFSPLVLGGLVACGDSRQEAAPQSSAISITSAPPTDAAEMTTAESFPEASESIDSERTTSVSSRLNEDVREVAERFATLAPESLFEKFDSCNPSGITGGYECSGADVGQFQFFESDAKAASTTQLLTELRSSRVVLDEGDRVVGWTTLGTTAVLTVVDNDLGLVMQQMISSDREDPEDRIRELGLVPNEPSQEPTAATTAASQPA